MLRSICSRKVATGLISFSVLFACCRSSGAATLTSIEPDNYAVGTDLNTIEPGVVLGIYNTSLGGLEPAVIADIESIVDPHPSTGSRIFGFNDFPFLSAGRQLNIAFDALTDFASIDFIGSSEIGDVIGIFEAYNSSGVLVSTYTTGGLGLNEIETMSFSRSAPDIKFARAYSSASGLPFGRMDNLDFNKFEAVPEPATFLLVSVASAVVVASCRGRRS
jgi:hypothetical protein